jgi:hypothetical protein
MPHQRYGPTNPEATYVAHKYEERVVDASGQRIDCQSFPTMGHSMHGQEPPLFASTLIEWAKSLGD